MYKMTQTDYENIADYIDEHFEDQESMMENSITEDTWNGDNVIEHNRTGLNNNWKLFRNLLNVLRQHSEFNDETGAEEFTDFFHEHDLGHIDECHQLVSVNRLKFW